MESQPEPELGPKRASLFDRFGEYRRDLTLADEAGLSLAEYDALPEFERGLREARWQERQEQCRRCGLPRSVCSDPARKFHPQREIDYAVMEREAANAAYMRLHEARPWHDGTFQNWVEAPSALHPYKYDMGVTIGVTETDLRPHDKFTTRESADPFAVADPDDGEED